MNPNKIEYIRGDKSLLEKFKKTAGLLQILLSCRTDLTPLQSPQGDIMASSWRMVENYNRSSYEARIPPWKGEQGGCKKAYHETQTQ
jgi:hypothetical protein